MSRKKRDFTRVILPDPKFGDTLVAKCINVLMQRGKKGIAERAVYEALERVQAQVKDNEPLDFFHRAIENIRPLVEVKSRRVGGATYQVPTEVSAPRGQQLALRWLKYAVNDRSERTLAERLAAELNDAFNNRGGAMKKREETHKMADANKAFAHFRF